MIDKLLDSPASSPHLISMPLHLTKIAYGAKNWDDLVGWYENRKEFRLTTRYQPKRHEEMNGGSLYWILNQSLVARSLILGFEQRKDGRWHIDLEPRLVRVQPIPRRAHQGWRYLEDKDAPPDLGDGAEGAEDIPAEMLGELSDLGLV